MTPEHFCFWECSKPHTLYLFYIKEGISPSAKEERAVVRGDTSPREFWHRVPRLKRRFSVISLLVIRFSRLRQHSQLPIIIATEYSRSHDSPTVVSYGTIIPALDDWLCHFGGTTSDDYCLSLSYIYIISKIFVSVNMFFKFLNSFYY